MGDTLKKRILAAFDLTEDSGNAGQRQAVLERERDVVVTAGAGSGKTRTLVARYMSLLADGVDVRRIAAITFTEKAAREMRSRVRATLEELLQAAKSEEERATLREWQGQMDAARVSTIHSLCAEILRTHPAEAVVDPKFEVLDEGLAAAQRAESVREAMYAMAEQAVFTPIFEWIETRTLETMLGYLLDRRLQAGEALERMTDPAKIIRQAVAVMMATAETGDNLAILQVARWDALVEDGGEKLAGQICEMLALWTQAEEALAQGDLGACGAALFQARREKMVLNIGKRDSSFKAALRALREEYDVHLNLIFGGKDAKDEPLDAETERAYREVWPLMGEAFRLARATYEKALEGLSALDFDDLEGRAAALLQDVEIQKKWRSEVDALLVDEFQDTNQRQRDIVEALTGQSGKLFIVGDAKQSIYRFRQADVAVFRSIRESIQAKQGLAIRLDTTYRAHAWLLAGMNDLLRSVMGEIADPARPYFEPFSAMRAYRDSSAERIQPPHIEFVIGRGENAADGRPDAARALAVRLRELKDDGQIKEWDEAALLFRSANGFRYYEDAFEEAGIPFVTVAGKGFYERAEIRDVLNMLYALSDPMDDLAMAGLLRSPAFGLRDATLYAMRWAEKEPAHFWDVLQGGLDFLGEDERMRAERAREVLHDLMPLVDRVAVAGLLKKLIDLTDYRAILAIGEAQGGARLWRNLDKLVDDARASGKTNVRDFLMYLETINATGAREGEAAAEAQGAVRLMTIHKSKGLQFPLVVLADAGRSPRSGGEAVYLDPELGVAFKLEKETLAYRMAKLHDQAQNEAEEERILYVALTRAQEKLVISGHVTGDADKGWRAYGWLDLLSGMAGVDTGGVIEGAGEALLSQTFSGAAVRAWALEGGTKLAHGVVEKEEKREKDGAGEREALFAPLWIESAREMSMDEGDERYRQPVTGVTGVVSGKVIGTMVHAAIAQWKFPGDAGLERLVETAAMQAGLAEEQQRGQAVRKAITLLERLKGNDIYQVISQASERYHELPYSSMVKGTAQTGYIDLLYKNESGWHVVDFKTDAIATKEKRTDLVEEYRGQVERYAVVVKGFVGEAMDAAICFLDDQGIVSIERVE
jgi:ATP-dependent helicase/nuclease subunit A